MTESAARLVDHVLPHVPIRQWVLSLPYRLRYRVAWNHVLCRAVLGVYAHALYAPPENPPGTSDAEACSPDSRHRE